MWQRVAEGGVVMVVLHLSFLNLAFGTVPLSAAQWCVCVAMASEVLWFGEGRKLLRRLWTRRALASPPHRVSPQTNK